MTDILCNWLNVELQLSTKIDQTNFAKEFSTGYLIGETLSKYQMQSDFDQFSQSRTNDSKLNNFTRLEPTLHLLGVQFDTNVARSIMTETHGVATRIMYQLFIALHNKEKANLTGAAMETMRAPAPVKLEGVESTIYKERLKHLTPRQTDVNLEALGSRFHKKQIEMESVSFKERFEEEERRQQLLQDQRHELMEKSRLARQKQSETMAKIQAAVVHIPKPPPSKTAKSVSMRKELRKRREAEETLTLISSFEERLNTGMPSTRLGADAAGDSYKEEETVEDKDPLDYMKSQSNSDYINKIRKRLQEDASARSEREKRRRKVLVDQLKAHEAQEEAHREEMLVNRLMRQSQQERRIAVQLLQVRHEKEVIRNNRLMEDKQFEARRLKEFEDALNREAEMARLAKLDYIEQTKRDKELHDRIMAERAEQRYRKHYDMCAEVMDQVCDFATKIGEYRELTNGLLPPKLMREWTSLFVEGKPLYEAADGVGLQGKTKELTPEEVLEEERLALLDEGDFSEYKSMMGEWQPPDDSEIKEPPRNNPILGHIVQRLFDMVHPPTPPPNPPEFPPFPIKACILGKVFSGKTTIVQRLASQHRLQVLSSETVVEEAIEAFKNAETELVEDVEEQVEIEKTTPEAITPNPEAIPSEVQPDEKPAETKEQTAPPSVPAEDGVEKSDPEKPIEQPEARAATTTKKTKAPPKPQPTMRARLGKQASKLLKKGKPVEDQLIVDILANVIRNLPEGTGWVMDGFPSTYQQAKLLEKALSGFDTEAKNKEKEKSKEKGKMRKSMLAPDPKPKPEPAEPKSGIDVVILFDIADELVLKRSAGRTQGIQSDMQYQQEFNPPPEGSATGVAKQEQVVPVEDAAHDMEQVQHRITGFLDSWPKMEKWFGRLGSLKSVDAALDYNTVFLETENVLEDTLDRLQGKGKYAPPPEPTEPPPPPEPEKPVEVPKPPEPEPPKEDSGSEGKRSRPTSKKGSRDGSAKSRSKSKGAESPKRKGSKGESAGKRSQSGSPKRAKSGSKKGKAKTPTPEPEPEPEEPPGTPPPEPGSELWQYVDLDIDMEVARILAPHWEAVETSYIDNSKHSFRCIRSERENIYRYFHQIRQDYVEYLQRPDTKQEFVTHWVKDYNELPDDMRGDEETKMELHERLDDLRERLWNICDDRKEKAENERGDIINDGWLDDRLGVLSNLYITIMQGEVDRFQDTVRLLKDYYKSMNAPIPDELNRVYQRLPLIDLPQTDPPGSPPKSSASGEIAVNSQEETQPTTPRAKESKSGSKPGTPKANTPSAKKKGKKGTTPPPEESQTIEGPPEPIDIKTEIHLVPRRPISPDPNAPGTTPAKDKKDKGKGKKTTTSEEKIDSPIPPQDPDEKLVFDALQSGKAAVDSIVSTEQAVRETEEAAQLELELEKQREREAAANAKKGGGGKGGKGKKSRSPSPKKGKGKDPPKEATPPPPMEETEEEKEAKQIKENMKKEFFAAMFEEEAAVKKRMELIKIHACNILQDLKLKADGAYKDMNDWLGARFLKEMESIDHMSELLRNAIEECEKVKHDLKLHQDDFVVCSDVKAVRTPSPPARPPPSEPTLPEQFTVSQLLALYKQFVSSAPNGMISAKAFLDMFSDFTAVSHGSEVLPDMWSNVTHHQLQEVVSQISHDGEYIDWRVFLLGASQPWPRPSQTDLLTTLSAFQDMDQNRTGFVTREQFERVELWFDNIPKPVTPLEPMLAKPFDRLSNLKKLFFDFFADHTSDPSQLDYMYMLMYFSMSNDPYDGFLRALSVAVGTHMPRPPPKLSVISTIDGMSDDASTTIQEPDTLTSDIPASATNAKVPLEALLHVLHHGDHQHGDSHRFSISSEFEDVMSKEKLTAAYEDLGSEDNEPMAYVTLLEHPVLQDVINSCRKFRLPDFKVILNNQTFSDNIDATSIIKTPEP